jgi:hypothetical protein
VPTMHVKLASGLEDSPILFRLSDWTRIISERKKFGVEGRYFHSRHHSKMIGDAFFHC